MPKIENSKVLGHPIFLGGQQYPQITTINMYLLNEIKYNVHMQCHRGGHRYYIEVKKNHLTETDIHKNFLGCPEG